MSSRKVEDLIPVMQVLFHDFEAAMAKAGLEFVVTCTFRSQQEQDQLYAQGRTMPGPIVTWTEHSKHSEGKAFDVAVLENGKVTWDAGKYIVPGQIGESVGLFWGGRWKTPDRPHFELKEGK
jgi:peptidoglycan L-alanyl-D-glutamate endopeptidase CwlK